MEAKLNRLLMLAGATLIAEVHQMAELDELTAQVAATVELEGSAVVLIQGIAQKLEEALASGNPLALVALRDQLRSSADALAAAVIANTPAA